MPMTVEVFSMDDSKDESPFEGQVTVIQLLTLAD